VTRVRRREKINQSTNGSKEGAREADEEEREADEEERTLRRFLNKHTRPRFRGARGARRAHTRAPWRRRSIRRVGGGTGGLSANQTNTHKGGVMRRGETDNGTKRKGQPIVTRAARVWGGVVQSGCISKEKHYCARVLFLVEGSEKGRRGQPRTQGVGAGHVCRVANLGGKKQ
jgi:hypothetical protein